MARNTNKKSIDGWSFSIDTDEQEEVPNLKTLKSAKSLEPGKKTSFLPVIQTKKPLAKSKSEYNGLKQSHYFKYKKNQLIHQRKSLKKPAQRLIKCVNILPFNFDSLYLVSPRYK